MKTKQECKELMTGLMWLEKRGMHTEYTQGAIAMLREILGEDENDS